MVLTNPIPLDKEHEIVANSNDLKGDDPKLSASWAKSSELMEKMGS